ncbi:MAG: RIP metalloprotease RseP [Gammaproteobacteria bacterium]|nr:RIP metalloprotease RseP [Gammaproteobacteria bacterium]
MLADIAGSIWWLLVVLGLLVTFHEFGHFWVARRMGVRVLRFSIGFGRPLFRKTARDGTEYVIAALPLGGYVKMLDEREDDVPEQQLDQAFNRKSLAARTAIVAAGPVFNLVFAIAAFWLMFMVGTQELRPVVGVSEGFAARAGVPPDSQIVAIDEQTTATWTHVVLGLMGPALDGDRVLLTLQQDAGRGATIQRELDFAQLLKPVDEANLLDDLGLRPWQFTMAMPAQLGQLTEDGAASAAGLQVGDTIVAIEDTRIDSWYAMSEYMDEHARAGVPLQVTVRRDDREQRYELVPKLAQDSQRVLLGIGASQPDEASIAQWRETYYFNWRFGPLAAVGAAGSELWRLTTSTLGMLGRMLSGQASVKNLSGPITIAQMANESAGMGLSRFLFFLGLLSLSLAILNLLPIPMLDGGHLMYYAIEAVTGQPVSERIQMVGQGIGLLLLAALMGLAFTNDILRLFT